MVKPTRPSSKGDDMRIVGEDVPQNSTLESPLTGKDIISLITAEDVPNILFMRSLNNEYY